MQVNNMDEYLLTPPFPGILQFETGTNCNAKCLMCPHEKMRRRGTARWSLISKLLREASNHNVELVCPFLMQEPMLEPRLTAVLANIRQRLPRATVAVYSNMSVLPEETMRRIVDYDLVDELHISFYGPTEALYRKWQPPLDREKTIGNIKRFHTYRTQRKKTKPEMLLHMLSVSELFQASKGYIPLLPYLDKVGNVQFDTFHGDIPDLAGDQTNFLGPPMPRVPCQRLWTGFNVHYDGSVVPCCIDYNGDYVLGNVSQDSIEDIWLNTEYQKLRLLHMQGRQEEVPMCRDCVVHKYQFSKKWTLYWLNRKLLVTSKC